MNKLFLKKVIGDIVPRKITRSHEFRVLMYHSLSDKIDKSQITTPLCLFEQHMQILAERKYAVGKDIILTFDDGFLDNLKMIPILEKFRFPATIFIATDFIGRSSYLNWIDLKRLLETKLITLGSHTQSHRLLSRLTDVELEEEIMGSKKKLEDNLGIEIFSFAYPFGCYGSFDKRALRILKKAGYRAAFTNIAGKNSVTTDQYQLRRTRISWMDEPKEFVKELQGAYDWYSWWQFLRRTSENISKSI